MATETIVSPGVLLQETDKSFVTPGVDPSGMAIIGPAVKGPVEIPTLVSNYNEFKTIYGTTLESASNAYEYYTSLAAKNYFQNGGSTALVVRVVDTADSWTAASSSLITDNGLGTNNPFTLESLGKGALLNSEGPYYTGGALHSGSKDNFRWEVSNVNEKAGTFTVSIRRGDDTTNAPIVLEQFTNCSLDPLSPNYIARKIGDQYFEKDATTDPVSVVVRGEFPNKSQLVRVSAVNLPTYEYLASNGSVNIDSSGNPFNQYLPTAQSGTFDGGTGTNTSGNPLFGADGSAAGAIQGLATSDYDDAISILKNKEEFKFKTLIIPGVTQVDHPTLVNTVIANTTFRGDSLFVVDTVDYGATISATKTEAESLDTNYAATYWPWAQVRSTELGRNVWCPASVIVPGVFAKNDSLAAPWFAPAGLTRGGVTNVSKVETKLSKTQRDDLYTSKVNPIATFPGQGIVIFGQKTLQNASSALDRVNVRRMLLDVKDTIGGFSRKLVFEQNTASTRDRFVRQATPYLESLVQRQGLYAFQVKMDGQLNTSDIIDENKLVGQVFLQPTKTAEFVVLDFVLTPTGASFTD